MLLVLAKTPAAALQSVLHVLCAPKPVTRRLAPLAKDPSQPPAFRPAFRPVRQPASEEVLVPGALYTDCSVVRLTLRVPETIPYRDKEQLPGNTEQFDLGLGDEPIGRAVWEALEVGVRIWERREKQKDRESE